MAEAIEKIEFTSDQAEMPRLSSWLQELFERYQMSEKSRFFIDLAVEEAVTNLISYAYPDHSPGPIQLLFIPEQNVFTMELVDKGVAFNPLEKQAEKKAENIFDAKIGGLGIELIKNYTKHLQYNYKEGENHLVMVFER